MGLFSKKTCDICGANMGLITDQKVSDGGICKECAKKLSIYFTEARHTSLKDIKQQIADREENRKKLDDFETTYAFGEFGCILIDEKHKQFVALDNTSEGLFGSAISVTSLDQIIDRNPDIIQFSQIDEVKIIENMMTSEEKQKVDGKEVSYSPKHMSYRVSFTLNITVNHPYIRTIYIPICKSLEIRCDEPRQVSTFAEKSASWLMGRPEMKVENIEKVYDHTSFMDLFYRSEYELPAYSYGFKCSLRNRDKIKQYGANKQLCEEIKRILTQKE